LTETVQNTIAGDSAANAVTEQMILAAIVTGAHGVSGNVRLRLIGANAEVAAEALRNASSILATREEGALRRDLTLTSLRKQAQAKGAWIATFKGITDRNSAEEIYGFSLLVPERSLPKLPDGEYYVDQLIGLTVVSDKDRPFGDLVEILNTPANDVYVTSAGAMIPAVSEFIKSIDIDAGRIVVADVPGLLDT
jgi:16S rRNA processing protein RimM